MTSFTLVTRPEPDASLLAEKLRSKSLYPLVEPLFALRFSGKPPPVKNYQGLLATSRNAIRALEACGAAQNFSLFPFLAVGAETEREARAAGFQTVVSANQSAASLAELAERTFDPQGGPILYLASKQRKSALEETLGEKGFQIEIWEAYGTEPCSELRKATALALEERRIGTVLLFSERASEHFLRLGQRFQQEILAAPIYACLSQQVAKPLSAAGLSVQIAHEAREDSLLKLLASE